MKISTLNRILYVDDDPDIEKLVCLYLEQVGRFSVRSCNSGMDALKEVLDFKPDLIILDVIMPDMDGPEILLGLRKIPEAAQVPVIFMTSMINFKESKEMKSYEKIGAIGVIIKPFNAMNLVDQVKELWTLYIRGRN